MGDRGERTANTLPAPITVTIWPDETTRGPNRACVWIATATVDGQVYTARSRHGVVEELARRLVEAGLADRPLRIRDRGVETGTYRSFHAAAKWTFSEGGALRRARWKAFSRSVLDPDKGRGE